MFLVAVIKAKPDTGHTSANSSVRHDCAKIKKVSSAKITSCKCNRKAGIISYFGIHVVKLVDQLLAYVPQFSFFLFVSAFGCLFFSGRASL